MQRLHSSHLKSFGLAITLGTLVVGSGWASTIPTGQVNFGGSVTVGANYINFFGGPSGNTPNLIQANQPDTGGYAGLTGGTIQNLTSSNSMPGGSTLAKFITLNVTPTSNNAAGVVFFDLLGFTPGTGTAAGCSSNTVGNVCTPTGSAFTLTQKSGGAVEVDLGIFGISYSGSSSTGSDVTNGLLTSQNLFPGTISAILNAAGSPSGFQDSYSATLASTAPSSVPEPGTIFGLGSGLLLLSAGSLRKKLRG